MFNSDGKFYTYGQALDHVNCIIKPNPENEAQGGLWLGDLNAASSKKIIQENKIRAVLTVASGTHLIYSQELVDNHLVIEADDFPTYDMSPNFQKINQFIHSNLETTNVLVHCFQGMSRSATAVIAYIMWYKEMTYDQAFHFVQISRPGIYPNIGFVKQLKKYQDKLAHQLDKEENPVKRNREKILKIYQEHKINVNTENSQSSF